MLLLEVNPYFYFLDELSVHLLTSNWKIPSGGSTDIEREYTNNVIHLFPMFHICMIDKWNDY